MSEQSGAATLDDRESGEGAGDERGGESTTSLWGDAWRDLRKNPLFIVSALVVLMVISWAAFPGLWTTLSPDKVNLATNKQPPSWFPGAPDNVAPGHWFGTTVQGNDMYTYIIYGARPSIIIAVAVTLLTALIGGFLGVVSGFYGGWTDTIISRVTDIFLGLPFILGALVFLALLNKQNIYTVSLVLVVLGWTQMSRIVRGTVISLRSQDFVEAARALGAKNSWIIRKHIVPNALAPIIVLSTLYVGTFVAAEATLTFIGVGLQQPTVSWGVTIAEGQNYAVAGLPHLLVFPSIALVITVLSFILLGDVLRDALDPRER